MKRRKGTKLRAIWPNAGVTADYRGRLDRLIERMTRSVSRWIERAYRAHPPVMAMDDVPGGFQGPKIEAKPWDAGGGKTQWEAWVDGEPMLRKDGTPRRFASAGSAIRAAKVALDVYLPADELSAAMDEMAATWQSNFDSAAEDVANHFAKSAAKRSDWTLVSALKKKGFAVEFQTTPAMRDVMGATVDANVALIKSIPQKYLGNVRGAVMRSVQEGRDLAPLAKYLEEQRGVTKRRAAFIALDQNNKATAALTRVRRMEIGLTKAVWKHSHAGKTPRPTHLKNDGNEFDVETGWYDPHEGKHIQPGELINCRCVSIPIVPGFTVKDTAPNPATLKTSTSAERWKQRF